MGSKVSPNTAFISAAKEGNAIEVRSLLDNGADIEANDKGYGGTALINAAPGGHLSVVQVLLEKGANIEAKGGGGQP